MKISFTHPENNKTYELFDHQEVVSIGDATLEVEIGEDKDKFNFSIVFRKDPKKTNPYRKFEPENDSLTIVLYNFYNSFGAFFPDILDLTNGYSLHIASIYAEESKIRRTQIFYYCRSN